MIQEELTVPGLSTEREPTNRRRFDPIRVAVHVVLVLYLLPVILLVGVIGVTAVGFQWLARGISKIVGPRDEPLVPRMMADGRTIGSRPVAVIRRKRNRAVR